MTSQIKLFLRNHEDLSLSPHVKKAGLWWIVNAFSPGTEETEDALKLTDQARLTGEPIPQNLFIFTSPTLGLQVCDTLASKKRKQNPGFGGVNTAHACKASSSYPGPSPHPSPKVSLPVSFPVKVGGNPREAVGLEKQANPCGKQFWFCLSRVPPLFFKDLMHLLSLLFW